MCDNFKKENELAKKDEQESDIKSLDTEEKNKLDTYYSSTEQDNSKVLSESDSVNRANHTESLNEKSDSMSQSNNIDESMSDRVVSTEKSESITESNTEKNSETSSVRSNSEAMEEDKENIEEGMYQIPTNTEKIMQENEYMNEFANNLSELD